MGGDAEEEEPGPPEKKKLSGEDSDAAGQWSSRPLQDPSRSQGTSSASSTSSTKGPAALQALLEAPDSEFNREINSLKSDRDRLRKEKAQLSSQIRNVERKRSRLRSKARLLTSDDLLEVYAMRTRESLKRDHNQVQKD